MNDRNTRDFGSQAWYRKVAMILLLPFVLPTIPLVLLIFACIGLYAVVANYFSERQIRRRMKQSGRYLSLSDVRDRIAACGGTLIIESPSLGWNFTHAWWTPDEIVATSPFSVPGENEYKIAAERMECLEWDRWVWDNYTCLDKGRAFLIRVWNGASMEQRLTKSFTNLDIVRTRTALMHVPKPPENPNASAAQQIKD
jgi:hypothetical protein